MCFSRTNQSVANIALIAVSVAFLFLAASLSANAEQTDALDAPASSGANASRLVRIEAKPSPIEIDVSQAAVLVVDMQNDFGAKEGMLGRAGIDISGIQKIVGPIARVLVAAREASLPVVYLKMGYRSDLSDLGPEGSPNRDQHLMVGVGEKMRAPDGSESRVLIRDTWNTDILSELKPHKGDAIVYKTRYSGFYETDLDAVLKKLGAKYLIVTGCTTSVCVESTVRDAMFRDYSCVVLEDCTSEPLGRDLPRTNHEASLWLIETNFGWVANSAAVISAFAAAPVSTSPLFEAIRGGNVEGIRKSIEKEGDLNDQDDRGNTPLHLAALNLDVDTVALLVKAGANPNATNKWEDTPLIYSASSLEKVQLLVQHGADINVRATSGANVLSAASAGRDSFRVVRWLLDHGAKPDTKEPLEIRSAVLGGDVETVKILLAAGALRESKSSDDPFDSPVVLAAVLGNQPLVELLLKNSNSAGTLGDALNGAFHWAGFGQKASIARSLVVTGANVRAPFSAHDYLDPSPMDGTLPLHWATYNEQDDPELVQILLQQGADVNGVNDAGETALDWANKRGHRQIVATLTAAGAKPGHRRAKTKTIPRRAVPKSSPERQHFIRQSVERALALMERSSDAFISSGLAQTQNCVSCHHQSLTAIAASWANARGIRTDSASLRRSLDATLRMLEPRIPKCYEGNLPAPNPAIENGYMLMQLEAFGYPADAVTDALVWQLAASQMPDGNWPRTATRPPLEHGHIKSTALAVKALRTYPLPSRQKEFEERTERARSWLEHATAESPTELAFQLLGQSWAGAKPHSLASQTNAILAAQKSDGGWPSLANLESDAWITGLNLVALHEAGGVQADDPAYERGVDFLLRTQFDDGSWWVRSRTIPAQPHFDSQFPHGKDQFISAAGTGWATLALLLTLEATPQASTLSAQLDGARIESRPAVPKDQRVTPRSPAPAVSFKRDIQPILERSCTDCHSGENPKGKLHAESLTGLMKGGQSGNPAVIAGHADLSPLIRFTRDEVEDLEMPPLQERPGYAPLTKDEIQKLSLWIDQGAPE